MAKTKELTKRHGVCQERTVSSVLEAVACASGSPLSAETRGKWKLEDEVWSAVHLWRTTSPPASDPNAHHANPEREKRTGVSAAPVVPAFSVACSPGARPSAVAALATARDSMLRCASG